MDITIRLDKLSDSDADVLRKYLDKYAKYLVYEEIADKTQKIHYQGIIYVEDEKAFQAAKVRFTSLFPSHKGGKKSMSKVRSKNYEVYVTKDKNLFASKGYTEEDIKALEEQSYKKDHSEDPKGGQFDRALQFCITRGISSSSNGWDICECLIDYYREHVKCEPNDFQLRSMTKSIYTQMVYKRAVEQNNMSYYNNYRANRARQIIGYEWVAA